VSAKKNNLTRLTSNSI